MLEPAKIKPLKSIEEVFESEVKFWNVPEINLKYVDEEVLKDRIIPTSKLTAGNKKYRGENNIATMTFCPLYLMLMEKYGNGKSYEGFYMVKEPIFKDRFNFIVDPTNPYIEKFQGWLDLANFNVKFQGQFKLKLFSSFFLTEIIDRSLEAGLTKIWDEKYFENQLTFGKYEEVPPEKDTLTYSDIFPYFLILPIGFFIAFLAFLSEKFFGRMKAEKLKVKHKRKIWRRRPETR